MDPYDLRLCLVQAQCLTMQSWIPSIIFSSRKASTSKAVVSFRVIELPFHHLTQILTPQISIQISTSERSTLTESVSEVKTFSIS